MENGAQRQTTELSRKSQPGPFSLVYKKRVYSPNRIKYPIKRMDRDPNGERNPQNRGWPNLRNIAPNKPKSDQLCD